MPDTEDEKKGVRPKLHGMNATIWVLEHAQDLVSLLIAVVLLGLSAVLLISGIVDFFKEIGKTSVNTAGIGLLDRVLLVLILVEILHTVILSLRAHRLVAQPFIVVGLVAVVRKVLFVLSNAAPAGTTQLALLLGMIAVFIAALIAVNHFERGDLRLLPVVRCRPVLAVRCLPSGACRPVLAVRCLPSGCLPSGACRQAVCLEGLPPGRRCPAASPGVALLAPSSRPSGFTIRPGQFHDRR